MKTMTIRNIPDEVADFIAKRASSAGTSMNATTVSLLEEAAGLVNPPAKRRDFSWLSGSWTRKETQMLEDALAECRTVDIEGWK